VKVEGVSGSLVGKNVLVIGVGGGGGGRAGELTSVLGESRPSPSPCIAGGERGG